MDYNNNSGTVYFRVNAGIGRSDTSGSASTFILADFINQFKTIKLYKVITGTTVKYGTDYANSDDPAYVWSWSTPVVSGTLTTGESVSVASLNIAHNIGFSLSIPASGSAGGGFILELIP